MDTEKIKKDAELTAETLKALKDALVNKGFSNEEASDLARASAAAGCANGDCSK